MEKSEQKTLQPRPQRPEWFLSRESQASFKSQQNKEQEEAARVAESLEELFKGQVQFNPSHFLLQRQAASDRPAPKKHSLREITEPEPEVGAQLREFRSDPADSVPGPGPGREVWQLQLGVKYITVPTVGKALFWAVAGVHWPASSPQSLLAMCHQNALLFPKEPYIEQVHDPRHIQGQTCQKSRPKTSQAALSSSSFHRYPFSLLL